MKCWAVQKILALHVGGDFPFFQDSIQHHLDQCTACTRIYSDYQTSIGKLKHLEDATLPENIFDGYWDEIYAQIASEKRVENSWAVPQPRKYLRPVLSAAAVILCALFLIWQPSFFDFSTPSTQEANITPPGHLKKETRLPKNAESPKIRVKQNEVFLFDKKENIMEYDLEQVQPLDSKKVSF